MEELTTYRNYEEYKSTVDKVLNKTVEDFVLIGYLLKKGRDTDILKGSGYANVNEFAEAEYHLDASQVSRFIRINDKFAVDGYSDRLKEEYRGYGYAKLSIMLMLPDALNEELSPAFSKTEIQAVKEEVEAEAKVTDIEVILEGEKVEQKELDNLEKGLHQLFLEDPKLFRRLYEQEKEAPDIRTVQENLAPDGEKVYSVRVQGYGRIMMLLNDSEETVTVFKVRNNEKEYYSWNDVKRYVDGLITKKPAKEQWEILYGGAFPEQKEEFAPVQPKKRKEPKVQKAKVQVEKKAEKETPNEPEVQKQPQEKAQKEAGKEAPEEVPEKVQEKELEKPEIAPVQPEKPQAEKEEENPELETGADLVNTKTEEDSDQIKGQTELVKDFPQFCPDSMNPPEPMSRSRKEYLDGLSVEQAAGYLAERMRSLPHFRMNFKDFWEKWLSEDVDESGEGMKR